MFPWLSLPQHAPAQRFNAERKQHARGLTVPVPAGHSKVFVHHDGLQCLQSCAPIGKQAKQVGAREKSTSLAYTTSTRFSFNAGRRAGDCGATVY